MVAGTPYHGRGLEGGLTLQAWVGLYQGCHSATPSGPQLREWPDGGPLIKQPAIAVVMFGLIDEMVGLEIKAVSGSRL